MIYAVYMEGGADLSRKTIEREARQKYVLDAARELFAEKGIEETSMEDIAHAVQYTRRTLYAYFPSREEISIRVFLDEMSARWAAQRRALAKTKAKTGLARLLVWGESFYEYSKANPQSLRLQFYFDLKGIARKRISKEAFAEFRSLNSELAEGLREIFRQGIRDGSLRSDLRVDLCISQYLYSLRSILNRALSPGYSFTKFDPDDYIHHFLDLFTRGLRRTGGKKR
jgi:AcrR family transcriptional regulator